MARQNWDELKNAIIADATGVTGTSEALLVPDWTFNAQELQQESVVHGVIRGKYTSDATPGTLTLRLRWGGLAGTLLAASAALVPGTSQTDITFGLEFWITIRAQGDTTTSMTAIAFGNVEGITSATGVNQVPASAPAAVASLDATVAKALSVTAQWSTTGETITAMMYALDVMN